MTCVWRYFSNSPPKYRSFSVLSLTENTQRYKSLAGFAIYCYAMRYTLRVRYVCFANEGFISYRTEQSEVYRYRVKRGYIAFALRTFRLTEKRRFVYYNESSLSFCLYSDMLTKVSVIFSLRTFPKLSRVAFLQVAYRSRRFGSTGSMTKELAQNPGLI